ncbi:ABC transporter substrate-binding protein [Actinoplanes sp. NPDC051851]|uniref:ABC transporter substrate-binding protein n=1 Tax=Actinoplanes sp. NPDC051851 TaxID=3154753 RepID=UPI00342C1F97
MAPRRSWFTVACVLSAVALALSACTGATRKADSATSTTLTFGEQQAPPSLNPGSIDVGFVDFTMLSYEPLFYQNPDGTVGPALAESWKYAGEGNKQLDVVLRGGVTFSDGDPVDADAVIASLEYSRDSQGNQSHLLAGATFVKTGDTTFSIKLATPDPVLPTILTQAYGIGQIISPKGLAKPADLTLANATHGAGPYVFDPAQSVSGDHYTYTANPAYYARDRQHYRKVVIRIIQNQQAAVNAAQTGQLDVFKGDYSFAAQARSAGLQVVANPAIMNGLNLIDRDGTIAEPLADLRVRQAINYAIDRDAVTKALLGEYGTATQQTVVEGADGYSAKLADRYPYDPAKAKQLLAEAGYPDGFELPVLAAVFAGFKDMGEAIAGQLAQVGIVLKVDTMTDLPSYIDNSTNGKYPAVVFGYPSYPIYLQGKDLFLPGSKSFNGFGTADAKLDALWAKAAAAPDTERAALDVQIEEYLVENAWYAPVSYTPVMYFARTTVSGVATSVGAPFASPTDWSAA